MNTARPADTTQTVSGSTRLSTATAALLAGAYVAISVGATLALGAAVPSLEGKSRDLIVEALLAGFVVVLVVALGWRREAGFTWIRDWRRPLLLLVPLAVTLLPFAGGVKEASVGPAILIVGYTLNSIAEDGMFSGVLPNVLRTRGLLTVVLVAPLLFGLVHFGNLASRPDQSVAITAAQAVGVFTQGIGLLLVRMCVNSVIPVMVIHGLADLFLQYGGVPLVPANVAESVIFLAYGIWLYRRYKPELAELGWPLHRVR